MQHIRTQTPPLPSPPCPPPQTLFPVAPLPPLPPLRARATSRSILHWVTQPHRPLLHVAFVACVVGSVVGQTALFERVCPEWPASVVVIAGAAVGFAGGVSIFYGLLTPLWVVVRICTPQLAQWHAERRAQQQRQAAAAASGGLSGGAGGSGASVFGLGGGVGVGGGVGAAATAIV